LTAGEVGYIATGLKTVRECRVGDTITLGTKRPNHPCPVTSPSSRWSLPVFTPPKGKITPCSKRRWNGLQLNDASLVFEPETSDALNFGFRCGFLGLFHMEIVQERLEREYDLDLVATAPSVRYEVLMAHTDEVRIIDSPADLPDPGTIEEIREPWMHVQIFTPDEYYGGDGAGYQAAGEFVGQEYPAPGRVVLKFDLPLAEIIVDFYDKLKSATRGYASMDYEIGGYRHLIW
jgi:GTP-binding protein LepA